MNAPKSAPSHSFLSISTVFSGRAVPVSLKVVKPASRSTKLNFRPRDEGRASRMRRPACQKVSSCLGQYQKCLRESLLFRCHLQVSNLPIVSRTCLATSGKVIDLFAESLLPYCRRVVASTKSGEL